MKEDTVMWSRKELKEKAKFSFRRNYWKSVLVSLLFALIAGGGYAGSSAYKINVNNINNPENVKVKESVIYDIDPDVLEEGLQGDGEEVLELLREKIFPNVTKAALMSAMAVFFIVFLIVFLVVLAVVIVLDAFLFNPLEVGCDRFFTRNLSDAATVKEVAFAYDHNYKNIVNTMFFRDLYTFLWTLLLIIPGIVKSYEYQMIPFLLAENPQMTRDQAFATSKSMMQGQKWRAFVLDLSFLGWKILSVFTFGILDIFYVAPYMNNTHAALYETLRDRQNIHQIEG